MFGPLGLPELIFIMVLALLVFGPRKLPEIGRTLGRGLAEFRKASSELKRTVDAEMMREELRQNDPRRLLREEPKPRRAAESPEDEKPDRRSTPEYEAPAATVARGSSSSADAANAAADLAKEGASTESTEPTSQPEESTDPKTDSSTES